MVGDEDRRAGEPGEVLAPADGELAEARERREKEARLQRRPGAAHPARARPFLCMQLRLKLGRRLHRREYEPQATRSASSARSPTVISGRPPTPSSDACRRFTQATRRPKCAAPATSNAFEDT